MLALVHLGTVFLGVERLKVQPRCFSMFSTPVSVTICEVQEHVHNWTSRYAPSSILAHGLGPCNAPEPWHGLPRGRSNRPSQRWWPISLFHPKTCVQTPGTSPTYTSLFSGSEDAHAKISGAIVTPDPQRKFDIPADPLVTRTIIPASTL